MDMTDAIRYFGALALVRAGAIVFTPPPGEVPLHNHMAWWRYVPGANWRHPEGPNSTILRAPKDSGCAE